MELDLQAIARRTGRTVDEVQEVIAEAKGLMIPKGKRIMVTEGGVQRWSIITRLGAGLIRTDYGDFHQFDFSIDDGWAKYSVIYLGEVDGDFMPTLKKSDSLLMRIDSGCETGQVFGDLTCECRDQLVLALETIAKAGEGMIINIPRQDGRGLGLPHKLATLRLQQLLKMDTVESAHAIAPNGVIDVRTYSGAVGILKFFGITTTTRINLATNNPKKTEVFGENGFIVEELTPVVIAPTEHTAAHLCAKGEHLGHVGLIPEADKQGGRIA